MLDETMNQYINYINANIFMLKCRISFFFNIGYLIHMNIQYALYFNVIKNIMEPCRQCCIYQYQY